MKNRKKEPEVGSKTADEIPIFSGDGSHPLWQQINSADTVEELRHALYTVCCRIQDLETRMAKKRR